jgi:hypothetical protein
MGRGLGRGLGALIVNTEPSEPPPQEASDGHTDDTPQQAQANAVQTLAIDRIRPNPNQPRTHFDPTALNELAASIREHGIIQPLIVTESPEQAGHYWLIAGERRWRAAQLAELQAVGALSAADAASSRELKRSVDGRAVLLPGVRTIDDETLGLLAAGFFRGEKNAPAIPYARLEG